MLDPKAVAIFLSVVREGSFTKAASALDTSPSVVSRAIAKLESDLSVKLFHRTTRSLSLTVEGREFHQGARDLVVRTGELADSANHMARKFFDFDVILCASEAYLAQAPPLSGLGDLGDETVELQLGEQRYPHYSLNFIP